MKTLLFLSLVCLYSHSLKAQELNAVSSAIIESTVTSTTGTTYVPLATDNAVIVRVFNNSGTTLDFRIYGGGKAIPVPTATSIILRGIANSNQLSVKRDDNSNTPVTFYYIIER